MGRRPDPAVRERIIQEAEHLIHLKGIQATAMEDIARCCKMTKANLFHHYGSKQDLVLAVLEAKIADYRCRRVDPICCPQADPVESVAKMFADARDHYEGNGCKAGCFVANIALEMADVNEGFRIKVSEFFKEWAEGMARCLEKARAENRLQVAVDPRSAAEAIISLYEGAILLARTHRDPSVFERVGKIARSILERERRTKGGDN